MQGLIEEVELSGSEFRRSQRSEFAYDVRLWNEEEFSLTIFVDERLPRNTFKIVEVKT